MKGFFGHVFFFTNVSRVTALQSFYCRFVTGAEKGKILENGDGDVFFTDVPLANDKINALYSL